jgi:hypothetical protein
MAFGLQTAARTHPVEIAVNIQLEEVAWSIARPPRGLRLHPREPRLGEIEAINESVDKANGVVGPNVVVDRFRQKQKLLAFKSGNVRHA